MMKSPFRIACSIFAALGLVLVSAQPVDRVAIAFLVGEAVALLLLVAVSIATHYRRVAVDA